MQKQAKKFIFWKKKDAILKMCINKQIHEERTIGVLLSYILKSR